MSRIVALVVIAAWAVITLRAWRSVPGRRAADQFAGIWRLPWGKQFFVDFFGLETILALWMFTDASAKGTWLPAVVCTAAMPIFGAASGALYWLLRG